jgi:hypothetical protein
MTTFDGTWRRIADHAGPPPHTTTGLPLRYAIGYAVLADPGIRS